MRKILLGALVVVAAAQAQNPIINTDYTADPTARVFGDRVYLYPSHDIHSPVEQFKDWFCMADYHVYSSADLVDWTDHGVIVTQNKVPWVQPDSYSMWAPDCVEKDGKYYFYFPSAPKSPNGERRGFGVGVAIASNPIGPFVAEKELIKGLMGIDPCVMIDPKDGQPYIYWAGMGLRGAKLTDDMLQLASEPVLMEGMPEGFKEGPFVFERNGIYYLTFPWVRREGGTETLAYAMSTGPLGPFEFKGIIMEESPTGCWTNHHSIVEYNGEWYLFYHHNDYSPAHDKRRSTRIDHLTFNSDGTIQRVVPTLRGVGVSACQQPIQIDRYTSIDSDGASIGLIDESNPFAGWKTRFEKNGASLRYDRVDFGNTAHATLSARVRSDIGGKLSVTTPDGLKIAEIEVPKSDDWTIADASVEGQPIGVTDLIVTKVSGGPVEVDYVSFNFDF